MLNVDYAECRKLALYAECRYAKCHHAECRYPECRGAPVCNIGLRQNNPLTHETLQHEIKMRLKFGALKTICFPPQITI